MNDPTDQTNHEARLILANLHREYEPQNYRPAQREAAQALVDEFLQLAKSLQLPVEPLESGNTIAFGAPKGTKVWVGVAGASPVLGLVDFYGKGGDAPQAPELQYDPINRAFGGKDVDSNVAPTPGHPLPRVAPLTVMAEFAARLLQDKKTGS